MFSRSLLLLIGSLIGLGLVGTDVAVEDGEAEVTSGGHNANITCDDGSVANLIDVIFNNETHTLVDCVEGCGVLSVTSGDDVPAGVLHGTTVNISCSAGMQAVPETLTCLYGDWCASNAICVKTCGELVVADGETVPAGVFHGETVNITCNQGMVATPTTSATCSKGNWSVSDVTCVAEDVTTNDPPTDTTTTETDTTTAADAPCILLIGGYDVIGNPVVPGIEYYHPTEGVECNLDVIGNMSTDRVDETDQTSGCSLSATRQIVIREAYVNKTSIVYGLEDGSSTSLPLTYANEYVSGSTASSVGTSKCVSCGGAVDAYVTLINNCYQFDPSLDASQWTPIAPMPQSSLLPTSVSLTENDFYVVSGYDATWVPTFPKVYHLNVGDGTWATETSMTTKRAEHAAAPLSNTEFILCGGYNYEDSMLSSCEIYDAIQKEWRTTGNLNYARSGHVMVTFGGDVYALSGESAAGSGSSVEKYDRVTEMWEIVKDMQIGRGFFVAVAV